MLYYIILYSYYICLYHICCKCCIYAILCSYRDPMFLPAALALSQVPRITCMAMTGKEYSEVTAAPWKASAICAS